MPRFAANLSTMFPETPFAERFDRARACGFPAVECWFPYGLSVPALRDALAGAGQQLVLINTAPGGPCDWGLAAAPGREAAFESSMRQALDYAHALDVANVHVLAGLVAPGESASAAAAYRANLRRAARWAEGSGVTLLIEPLNARDRPGYLLARSDDAATLIGELGCGLKLLFDVYHVQIGEGDILTRLDLHRSVIGHVQIASVPGRREPDEGELAYPAIVHHLDDTGYAGWIGCEYAPRTTAEAGLGWREAYAARTSSIRPI